MLEFRVGFNPTDPVSPSPLTRTCSVGTRAFPDAVDLSLMTDPEAQERYWSDAVKRTEEMLDEVYARLRATHGTPYSTHPRPFHFILFLSRRREYLFVPPPVYPLSSRLLRIGANLRRSRLVRRFPRRRARG